MTVVLLRTWLVNIGNGFIDKGAKAQLDSVLNKHEVVEVSGFPNYVDERITSSSKIFPGGKTSRNINIGEWIEADAAVLPGCVLYEPALKRYFPTLKTLKENGTKLIFLGAGGGDYKHSTQRYVNKVMESLEPYGLITRDSRAFECYSHLFDKAYDGIDCAFFIDEWYSPPASTIPFTASTFDKLKEPEIDSEKTIVRPNHIPFQYPYTSPLNFAKMKLSNSLATEDKQGKNNTLVSDLLTDYLFIYANAQETHSDRIHACVPALAYGNAAQFYFDTPRAKLFEKLFDEIPKRQPAKLDNSKINTMKSDQLRQLKELLSELGIE